MLKLVALVLIGSPEPNMLLLVSTERESLKQERAGSSKIQPACAEDSANEPLAQTRCLSDLFGYCDGTHAKGPEKVGLAKHLEYFLAQSDM